jgi:transcriptional regulator with XRE-family HTH domain
LIGKALRSLREERGLSRAKLGKQISLSAAMIQKVEDGRVRCRISKTTLALLRWAPALAEFILPADILERICERGKIDKGESVDSPPV